MAVTDRRFRISFDDDGVDDRSSEPFTVLMVCTGNVARSPLAEALFLRKAADAQLPIRVMSAGTGALVGRSATDQAGALAQRYGGVASSHRARQVTRTLAEHADLVLTADREHRAEVVSLAPRVARRTFTMRQFARLASHVLTNSALPAHGRPREAFVALVRAASESRGLAPVDGAPSEDDVIDPYRQSQSVYDEAGRHIDAAMTTVIAAFQGCLRRE